MGISFSLLRAGRARRVQVAPYHEPASVSSTITERDLRHQVQLYDQTMVEIKELDNTRDQVCLFKSAYAYVYLVHCFYIVARAG